MATKYKLNVGQVVVDIRNKAFVEVVHLFKDDVQVDWYQDNVIASYHLDYNDVQVLTKKQIGYENLTRTR